jgi:hypothetical protein
MNAITATETIRVELDAEDVQIYISRQAGICGPAETAARPATLAQVDAWLASISYRRTGDWGMSTGYDGLRLAAEVARI